MRVIVRSIWPALSSDHVAGKNPRPVIQSRELVFRSVRPLCVTAFAMGAARKSLGPNSRLAFPQKGTSSARPAMSGRSKIGSPPAADQGLAHGQDKTNG